MTLESSQLIEILNKQSRLIIGLMSGMSYDGLDLALVRISGEFPELALELVDSHCFSYPQELKSLIEKLKDSNIEEISEMNFALGYYYADCVNEFFKIKKINPSHVDAIGSHGQTIFHKTSETKIPSTLQIGSGSVIAKKTGIITISNFREADMSVGGTGAPLVPYVDWVLYNSKYELPIAINNLGSISNLTIVTTNLEDVIAFDTGPANMPIDYFAKRVSNNPSGIDENGKISKSGSVIAPMLSELLSNKYFIIPPPKSAGYGEFGPKYCEEMAFKYPSYKSEDYVRTAVEFSAITIANAYKDFILHKYKLKKIIFSGGGSKNTFLLERIQSHLSEIEIVSMNDLSEEFSDSKEALSFALFANEFLSQRPANLPRVTGSTKQVVLGALNLP